MDVTMMKTSDIVRANFNPGQRISERNLRALKADIERRGIVSPLIMGWDGILADGHRRLQCAIDLGIEQVPVIVSNSPAHELFSINNTQRKVSSGEWFYAISTGLDSNYAPASIQYAATELERLIGRPLAFAMAERGKSPKSILDLAKRCAAYCGDETDNFVASCILWMDKCQQQNAFRKATESFNPIEPEKLRHSIETMQPLRFKVEPE